MDSFDKIRSALYLNSAERRSVSVGTPWFNEWEHAPAGILHDFVFTGNEPWHNWKICGWKQIAGQPYLIGKSWQGPNWGDRGYHYISRDTCNRVFALSGTAAFTVRKATAADIQTVRLSIVSTIISYCQMWLSNLFTMPSHTPPEPQNEPVPTVPVPVTQVPSTVPESEPAPVSADPDSYMLPWDTPRGAYHNTRVLCDRAGMTLEQKNILCACVFQESRFDNNAKHENRDAAGDVTSTDWGIAQINDYFHIGSGKDFPSVAYVLANPQDAIEFMIEMYQAAKLSLWSSYELGAYKVWLSPSSPMWELAA